MSLFQKHSFNWSHRWVWITGGSSGIGFETARLFTARGAHVSIIARRPELLRRAVTELERLRVRPDQCLRAIPLDVSDSAMVQTALQAEVRERGCPDVVVHSAGIVQPGYAHQLALDDYRRMMDVNYLGMVHVNREILPGMIERRSGYLVHVASLAAVIGLNGYAGYSASKYAVRGYSEVLRTELKPYHIHVSVVFPEDTDTPQLAYDLPLRPEEIEKLVGPISPPIPPQQVAKAILQGMERRRFLIFTSASGGLLYAAIGWLGPLQYLILDWLISRYRKHL